MTSREAFEELDFRDVSLMLDSWAWEMGAGEEDEAPKGVPITPANFGPDGKFRPPAGG